MHPPCKLSPGLVPQERLLQRELMSCSSCLKILAWPGPAVYASRPAGAWAPGPGLPAPSRWVGVVVELGWDPRGLQLVLTAGCVCPQVPEADGAGQAVAAQGSSQAVPPGAEGGRSSACCAQGRPGVHPPAATSAPTPGQHLRHCSRRSMPGERACIWEPEKGAVVTGCPRPHRLLAALAPLPHAGGWEAAL